MPKVSNIINVDKIMHENAKLGSKHIFNVSPNAVQEYRQRIIEHIEDNTYQLCIIAKKHKRKTVMENDVIELFGFVKNSVAGEERD